MSNLESFRLIAEALPEPTLLVTSDGVILAVNRATAAALPDLREGVSLSSRAVDHHDELLAFLRACARSRHFVPGALELGDDTGPYRIDAAGIDSPDDEHETLLVRLTPRRRGMDQIASLNQRVAALQEEIARRRESEERERQQRASAEASNRATERFLKMLSHELRTPLNAVVGWAHMLRMLKDPEQVSRAVDAIDRNANLQVKLLEDLAQATHVATETPHLDLQPIYLTPLVTAAVNTVRPAALERGVDLIVDAGSHGGTVLGDADRLQQIVANVLVSALLVAYGKGKLRVTLSRDDVRAEVEVNYTGASKGFIGDRALFDGTHALDSTVALTVARQFAELHGGSLDTVVSATSNDFTITLRLPLLPIGIEEPRRPSAQMDSTHACAGLRVLVVDDESDARALLAEVLTHHGANVDVAENAVLAMMALSKVKYDVLVSDIAMPFDDGFTLLEQVRKDAGPNRDVPAVAVTAHASIDVRDRAVAAGFAAYVTKPVTPQALVNVIATVGRSGLAQI